MGSAHPGLQGYIGEAAKLNTLSGGFLLKHGTHLQYCLIHPAHREHQLQMKHQSLRKLTKLLVTSYQVPPANATPEIGVETVAAETPGPQGIINPAEPIVTNCGFLLNPPVLFSVTGRPIIHPHA